MIQHTNYIPRNDVAAKPSIFLSYNSHDKIEVEGVFKQLVKCGIELFYDKRDLRLGDAVHEKIHDALEASRAIVVLIGENGLGEWQLKEILSVWETRMELKEKVLESNKDEKKSSKEVKIAPVYLDSWKTRWGGREKCYEDAGRLWTLQHFCWRDIDITGLDYKEINSLISPTAVPKQFVTTREARFAQIGLQFGFRGKEPPSLSLRDNYWFHELHHIPYEAKDDVISLDRNDFNSNEDYNFNRAKDWKVIHLLCDRFVSRFHDFHKEIRKFLHLEFSEEKSKELRSWIINLRDEFFEFHLKLLYGLRFVSPILIQNLANIVQYSDIISDLLYYEELNIERQHHKERYGGCRPGKKEVYNIDALDLIAERICLLLGSALTEADTVLVNYFRLPQYMNKSRS